MRSYEDHYQHRLRSCAAFTSLGLQDLSEGEMVEHVVKLILHLENKKICSLRLSKIYVYFNQVEITNVDLSVHGAWVL